jgi:hypothetical protein
MARISEAISPSTTPRGATLRGGGILCNVRADLRPLPAYARRGAFLSAGFKPAFQ